MATTRRVKKREGREEKKEQPAACKKSRIDHFNMSRATDEMGGKNEM